jgi:hypothetical protein
MNSSCITVLESEVNVGEPHLNEPKINLESFAVLLFCPSTYLYYFPALQPGQQQLQNPQFSGVKF